MRHSKCPIPQGAKRNLEFLVQIRNEIEHRLTSRIDDAISAKLQACCLNFNDEIKKQFGRQFGLERRIPISLQFATFGEDQREAFKKASDLPDHIRSFIDAFEHGLTDDEYADPAYRYRVAFVPFVSNRASSADTAIEFVRGDSDEAREVSQILLKEVEKRRFTATEVCNLMQSEGYPKFNQYSHTQLWKAVDGKNPAHQFGREGDYRNTWVWFDKWIDRVRAHCEENEGRYR